MKDIGSSNIETLSEQLRNVTEQLEKVADRLDHFESVFKNPEMHKSTVVLPDAEPGHHEEHKSFNPEAGP